MRIFWNIVSERNIFAHNYLAMSKKTIWEVAVNDIPVLKGFCEKFLVLSKV